MNETVTCTRRRREQLPHRTTRPTTRKSLSRLKIIVSTVKIVALPQSNFWTVTKNDLTHLPSHSIFYDQSTPRQEWILIFVLSVSVVSRSSSEARLVEGSG